MFLENLNPAKRNSRVTVNGHLYIIGSGGFIADESNNPVAVLPEDASKLLQGAAWKELSWDPSDPVNASRFLGPKKAAANGAVGRPPRDMSSMQWDQGIKPKTVDELGPQEISVGHAKAMEERPPTDSELLKAARKDVQLAKKESMLVEQDVELLATPDIDYPTLVPETEPVTPVAETPATTAASEQAPVDEYPDPTEEMPIEYLKQMADAYEVSYTHRTGKTRLVQDITAAMYPDEE